MDFEKNGACAMETQGRSPDYDVCPVPVPIRPLLEASKRTVVLHPAELGPEGVRLEDWTRQIMVRTRRAW